MMHRMRPCAVLATGLLLSGSSALAAGKAAKIPANASATVVASCIIAGATGNSPQTQSVRIGPLTWNYQGGSLTPATPIVQTISVTCSRGDAATVTLPSPPAGGFVAPSTKNGHSIPFVLWVTATSPTSCSAPPSASQLTQTSTSSTQPIRFYIAACANAKQAQQNSGDYTANLAGTLRY